MGAVKAYYLPDAEYPGAPCPTCHGDCYVESLVYGRGAGPEGLEPIYEQYDCPACGGSGWERVDPWAGAPLESEAPAVHPAAPPPLPLEAYEGEAAAAATLRRLSATETLAAFAGTFGETLNAGYDVVGEQDCPACHGEGGYEVIVGGWDEPIYEGRECPSCCGTGKAPVVAFTVRPWEPLADAPRREPTDINLTEVDLPF